MEIKVIRRKKGSFLYLRRSVYVPACRIDGVLKKGTGRNKSVKIVTVPWQNQAKIINEISDLLSVEETEQLQKYIDDFLKEDNKFWLDFNIESCTTKLESIIANEALNDASQANFDKLITQVCILKKRAKQAKLNVLSEKEIMKCLKK